MAVSFSHRTVADWVAEPYLLPDRLTGYAYLVFREHVLSDHLEWHSPLQWGPSNSYMRWYQRSFTNQCNCFSMQHIKGDELPWGTWGMVCTPARPEFTGFLLGPLENISVRITSRHRIVARFLAVADKINSTQRLCEEMDIHLQVFAVQQCPRAALWTPNM